MSFGKNLHGILGVLKLRLKDAADEIGISYNTLSNIINERFEASCDTKSKIEIFLNKHTYSLSDLEREVPLIRNIRIRTLKPLSGNEKSAVRKNLLLFENRAHSIDQLERQYLPINDYFDKYTLPYKSSREFTSDQRRKEFLIKFKEHFKNENPTTDTILHFLQNPTDTDKELYGTYYTSITIPFYFHDIRSLLGNLGIRISYISFGTEKIESFSTALYGEPDYITEMLWVPPSIILNSDICTTAEKSFFIMAKELYHMLSNIQTNNSEYTIIDFSPKIETRNDDAIKFAENFLLPQEKLQSFIKNYKEHLIYSFSTNVDYIKRNFLVSNELIIKQLHEGSFIDKNKTIDEYKKIYLKDLEYVYKDISSKPIILHGEPSPLPISYRGNDFYEIAILIGWKKEIISAKKCAVLLRCEPDEIAEKYKYNENIIQQTLT